MERYTLGHLGISVPPNCLTRHIMIMITGNQNTRTRKSNKTIIRIVGIVIEVLDHEDDDISPQIVIASCSKGTGT